MTHSLTDTVRFAALATALGGALGFSVTTADPAGIPRSATLTDAAGRTLRLSGHSSAPATVAVAGCYPPHPAVRRHLHPCITVPADQGVDVIAADITQRFLPAFYRTHERHAEQVARWDAAERVIAASAAALVARLPGARLTTAPGMRTVHAPDCTVYLGHDRTRIVVTDAPNGLADTVAGFLAARRAAPLRHTAR